MSEIRHILVVDDDALIRSVLLCALTRAGFTVEVATDGGAALDLTATHRFDLILLDLQMPNMDGPTFLERYTERNGPRARVIICSASVGIDQQVKRLPADGFLKKPFHFADLYAAVAQCAGQL